MDNTIILIGSEGFIGSTLKNSIKDLCHDLVTIDYSPTQSIYDNQLHVISDAYDVETYSNIQLENSVIVFMGGMLRPSPYSFNLAESIERECVAFCRLCEFFAKKNVKKIIFASSGGTVYGDIQRNSFSESHQERPSSNYGITKFINEHVLRKINIETGIETIALRISNPYGPGQRVARAHGFITYALNSLIESKKFVIWGDGTIIRDFIYIDDLVEAFVRAIKAVGVTGNINISSGKGYSLNEIIGIIERVAERKLMISYENPRGFDLQSTVLDNKRALYLLGWAPKVKISEGIRRAYEFIHKPN